MTTELQQALQLLDFICAKAPVDRDSHVAAQQALQRLAKALGGTEKPEVGSGGPEQGKA